MPDTSLTLKNLREHLRKHLAIYFVGLIAVLALSNLLWTTTAPRVPPEQAVLIYLADTYTNDEPLAEIAADMLARTQAYDPDLREVTFENLMFNDPEKDYTSAMLLMTRLAVGEGDAFLASATAMDALISSSAVMPLDDYVADGWLGDAGLEPYYATVVDEETGEQTTLLAGLRLDALDALYQMGAFNNEGAFLAVAVNGTNPDTAMKALEVMVEDLLEWSADA